MLGRRAACSPRERPGVHGRGLPLPPHFFISHSRRPGFGNALSVFNPCPAMRAGGCGPCRFASKTRRGRQAKGRCSCFDIDYARANEERLLRWGRASQGRGLAGDSLPVMFAACGWEWASLLGGRAVGFQGFALYLVLVVEGLSCPFDSQQPGSASSSFSGQSADEDETVFFGKEGRKEGREEGRNGVEEWGVCLLAWTATPGEVAKQLPRGGVAKRRPPGEWLRDDPRGSG